MPLLEMLQVLSRTPVTEPQLRAVVAVTCARWCVARGEDGEAQRLLTHAIELVPDLRPAMRLLYRIFLRRGDIRNSVRYLDQEIRATRHPREAAALYRERGQLVEAHFGDRSAALQCYQAALKATPRDLAVLRSVEAVALSQGNIFSLIANLASKYELKARQVEILIGERLERVGDGVVDQATHAQQVVLQIQEALVVVDSSGSGGHTIS